MPTLSVFQHLLLKDFLDILILTVFAYHLYVWLHQTKAIKAIVGLLGLGIIYSVAQYWGLFLTTWVFQILWQVLIILIIILFQAEIRQVLEKVNPFYALGWNKTVGHVPWIKSFSKTIFELAAQKIGALIIFERKDIGMLSPKNLKTNIDLSRVEIGKNDFFLDPQQLLLPNDRVEIIGIEPNPLTLEIRAKAEALNTD